MSIHKGINSLNKIKNILKPYNVERILVVTGKNSFNKCGAKEVIDKLLKDYTISYFNDFDVNPKLNDAKKGVKLAQKDNIQLIISIGGGSVLDMGKLIKALFLNLESANEIVQGHLNVLNPNISHFAIPTTAGSGSESTHFAVVYINNKKYSLADECLLPDEVILDGSLTLSLTKYQKACNVLDALSQSIESAWAVGSNAKSSKLSFLALSMCVNNFYNYVNADQNLITSQAMLEASNLAGQAINITKTTSAHAWSYGLTSNHGIPHGHAVWVTLPKIFELHLTSDANLITDPRGSEHLSSVMSKLMHILKISSHDNIDLFFKGMLSSIDIKANILKDLKIPKKSRIQLSLDVNKERMGNNPVIFEQSDINKIFQI